MHLTVTLVHKNSHHVCETGVDTPMQARQNAIVTLVYKNGCHVFETGVGTPVQARHFAPFVVPADVRTRVRLIG